ncbi:MAG TPA: DUF86 domain-containing protein [Candidatus Wallbacteria bacterium]|nr:DUF86 domain-containing protein [Candidatus Wallbacteria bacterium]
MHKKSQLANEILDQVREAILRIQRRFSNIETPEDFYGEQGSDKLDSITIMLIAIGESFKKIDKMTEVSLLAHYPQIDWKGVKGIRNIIVHDYFNIDAEEIFDVCKNDIPELLLVVKKMVGELE